MQYPPPVVGNPFAVLTAIEGQAALFRTAAALAVLTGASAVLGLSTGCVMMVRETQLAVKYLEEEAKTQAAHHGGTHPPPLAP